MDNVMTLDGRTGQNRPAAGNDSWSKEPQPAAVAAVNPPGESVDNLVLALDRAASPRKPPKPALRGRQFTGSRAV